MDSAFATLLIVLPWAVYFVCMVIIHGAYLTSAAQACTNKYIIAVWPRMPFYHQLTCSTIMHQHLFCSGQICTGCIETLIGVHEMHGQMYPN